MNRHELEEAFDYLCSQMETLEDDKKRQVLREVINSLLQEAEKRGAKELALEVERRVFRYSSKVNFNRKDIILIVEDQLTFSHAVS